jgi:hypothetical protein
MRWEVGKIEITTHICVCVLCICVNITASEVVLADKCDINGHIMDI